MRTVRRLFGWNDLDQGSGDLESNFGPLDLFHYIYALFHSTAYRADFAGGLRRDFPRVLLPAERDLFRSLRDSGMRLVRLHLLDAAQSTPQLPEFHGLPPLRLSSGFPKFKDRRILLAADCWLEAVNSDAWQFRVGGYQVCRKWLRDRRHSDLEERHWLQYQRIVWSLHQTLAEVSGIDRRIEAADRWQTFQAS